MTDTILVIDDDPTFNAVLSRTLSRRGFHVQSAQNADSALVLAKIDPPRGVVLDLNLGATSGLSLIRPLLDIVPNCRIVILTGYASITTAVEAIKRGATQYFAKPIEIDAIIAALGESEPRSDTALSATPLSLDRLEWEHLQRVLHEHDGNVSSTARAIKMHRRTLQRKLAKRPQKD